MRSTRTDLVLDGVPVARLENRILRVDVAPSVGGRIVSIRHLPSGHEYLWRHPSLPLRRVRPGAEYDPEFFGGIDEQIPCDLPELIDGVAYPDHGELWTQALAGAPDGRGLLLTGQLPLLGFAYQRRIELAQDAPEMRLSYRLANRSGVPRTFLWKLHAALAVSPGDRVACPASWARPLSLGWSRCRSLSSFSWPCYEGTDMSVVSPADGSAEFLALTGLTEGRIGWCRPSTGRAFRIGFDATVFPCCWLFASYGKLQGHYTVVLEPATSPVLTVEDGRAEGSGFTLPSGASLETEVTISVE